MVFPFRLGHAESRSRRTGSLAPESAAPRWTEVPNRLSTSDRQRTIQKRILVARLAHHLERVVSAEECRLDDRPTREHSRPTKQAMEDAAHSLDTDANRHQTA